MSRRLRVGVAVNESVYPPLSATRRMWREVLGRLGARPDLSLTRRPARRWPARAPEVVLYDGHEGVLPYSGRHVVHVHEAAWDDAELRPLFDAWFLERFAEPTRVALRHATGIIVPSASSADQVVYFAGVDPGRITVAPHGVELSVFKPEARDDDATRARLGVGNDAPYVLFVSTLHPRKNLAALQDAMGMLAARGFPHALVVVANASPDRADSSDLEAAATTGAPGATLRVQRVQRVTDDELAALMRGAAAFCLPSLMEGFGLTALEAMACGTPVVVSDRGSLPEVVGDAALVVAPTAADVAAALERVLTDSALAASLAAAGVGRAQTFTWERAVDRWHAALTVAAGAEPPPGVLP